jgi:catechol 2,3-dioxygenase-like lactoylglutathione lyase family enzyme
MRVKAGLKGRPGSTVKLEIGHIGLTVDDLGRSMGFYRGILGLAGGGTGRGVARFRSGRTSLVLHEKGLGGSGFHFGFRVSSFSKVDEWHGWLRGRNMVIYDDVTEKKYRSFKVRDPDGYFVEIFCDERAIAE